MVGFLTKSLVIKVIVVLVLGGAGFFVVREIPNILNSSDNNSEEESEYYNQLVSCHSSISVGPVPYEDFIVNTYSASLTEDYPEYENRNSVREFSYAGLLNETESNTVYTKFSREDYQSLGGYFTAIEVCNEDNMQKRMYSLAEVLPSEVNGGAVTATWNFLHDNDYLSGPGVYRIDAFVKDSSGWHLVDRMDNIVVTD
jgi:hypothetical protein